MGTPSGTSKMRAQMELLGEETSRAGSETGPQISQMWIVVKRFWPIWKDFRGFPCFSEISSTSYSTEIEILVFLYSFHDFLFFNEM